MIERKSLQTKQSNSFAKDNFGPKSWAVPLAFLVMGLLLTMLFAVFGFYPFGKDSVLISDLSAQYAPDLVAYKNQLMSGGVSSYSFLIGMGKNTFGLFAYYLASPLNFVTFLFPTTMIAESVLVLITIKLSLAAAFMTLFLRRRFGSHSGFAMLFGILYASCSYIVVYMINIMWLDGYFLLPLLLFFVEQFLENRKNWWKVALILFILFVSGFYIAYMVGIFSFLYFLARLWEDRKFEGAVAKKSLRSVRVFIGSALLAAGMSAVLLLPAGLDILGNSDQSAKDIALDSKFKLTDFLNQLFAGSFDSLSSNKPLVYCGLVVLFLCILFFLNPYFARRQKFLAGGALIFFVFSFNFTFLDLAWQLFDSPNWFLYRYSFLMVFVALMIAFASLIHIKSLVPKAFVITGLLFLALLIAVQGFGDLAKEGDRFYINLFMGGLELLCLFAMSGVPFPASIANLKRLIPALLTIVVCIEVVCVNPLFMRPKMYGVQPRERLSDAIYQAQDLVLDAKADAAAAANKDGKNGITGFFRMEADGSLLSALNPMTSGLYLDYPSISTFSSASNKQLNRLLKQLGFATNYNYFTSTHSYSSAVTDSLLGISYILSEKENYGGYEQLDKSENGMLFLQKNNQVMPLMYLVKNDANNFDIFAMEKDPANKNLFALQDDLLVTLFGTGHFAKPVYYDAKAGPVSVYNAVVRAERPKPTMTPGVSSSSVAETSASTTAETDKDLLGNEPVGQNLKYGITYLRISPEDVMSLTYDIQITSKDPLFLSIPAVAMNGKANIYVNGEYRCELTTSQFSQIISLGSFETGQTVTVSIFSDSDTYSILAVQLYYCDTALFAEQLASALQGQDIQITKAEDGYVSAQAAVSEDSLLLTTIPYEKGWTLHVDGIRTEITPYQSALIAIPLTAGRHTITLSFTAPGMQAGAIVSGASIAVFAGALIITFRKRRET